MFGSETVKVVQPTERRAVVPSDVMSLAKYIEFKRQFNERVLGENVKIQARNVKLANVFQPTIPELVPYPMDTVLMIGARAFIMTREDGKRVLIPAGVFHCPVELSDDWYMIANGVKAYVHPELAPVASAEAEAETGQSVGEPKAAPLKNLAKKK